MVMTAHILYPELESDKIVSVKTGVAESLPATMSDDILTKLLKNDMGFDGIVVTDAMNMTGISAIWDPIQACVVAIQAGVDMICMPTILYDLDDFTALDAIIDGIEDAVNNGDIPMTRINDAVSRILKVKKDRGILDYNAADYTLEKANGVVGCEANREMERELSAAAVTVVKNENNTLPLKLTNTSNVLMLVPYDVERAQTIMAWNRAKKAGIIPKGAEVKYSRFKSNDINAIKTELDWADTIIVISEVSSTSRMNGKHWLSALPINVCDYAAANNKTAIVMSVDKPYDVQSYSNADAVVAVYGCKGSSVDPAEALANGITGSETAYGPNIIAGVEVILGRFAAQGKLPLDIPVYNKGSNVYTNTNVYERGYGLTYDAVHDCAGTIAKYDSEKHWKECICGSKIDVQNHSFVGGNTCSCGFKKVVDSTIKIKNNNGSKTINYGETLKLTATVTDKPANSKIYWYVDGFIAGEGEVFNINFEKGTKIVTVKLVDENGVVYQNASGDEIADSETVTINSGFFQKIISFFKNLFGINRTVVQTIFKGIY